MVDCCAQVRQNKPLQDSYHDHLDNQDHVLCCPEEPFRLDNLAKAQVLEEGVRTSVRIMQMDCPTEEALIRKKLQGIAGIKHIEFNLIQRILTVVHTPNTLEPILNALRSLGFQPELLAASGQPVAIEEKEKKTCWPLLVAGVAALCAEAAHWLGLPAGVSATLAMLAVVTCGFRTYKKGWVAIRHGNLNINALMSIAVTGAMALGQWSEAAMVMVLFTVAEVIEAKSLVRARHAIKGLMKLAPEKVTVQQTDSSWLDVEAKNVTVGSLIRVKPGERIGLDGKIIRGRSSVNQAAITGESLPVEKTEGDAVFAGTINESATLEYQVTAEAKETTLARIIYAIE